MDKILLLSLVLISCGQARTKNQPRLPIHVLIDSIENHGSAKAFHALETASLDHRPGTFLSTFMIMADKYHHAFATMTVYRQMALMYNIPQLDHSENGIYALDSLDKDIKNMVSRYLIKAASLGNEEASEHLKEYRQKAIIK